MATTEANKGDFLRNVRMNGPYTIEEAREIMRTLDKFPTGTTNQVTWVSTKTKRPVAFSY